MSNILEQVYDTQPLTEKPPERATGIVHNAQGKPDVVTPGDRGVVVDVDRRRYRVSDEGDQIRIVPRKK